MPEINATDAERTAAGFTPRVADPLLLTPFNIGMAMYRHWLGATSRLIEDQCAHLLSYRSLQAETVEEVQAARQPVATVKRLSRIASQ